MAAVTYLEIVNKVMRRLRENDVTSVQETPYSRMIGELVNVVKREVEDSWNWSALRDTITANTVADTYRYSLTGSGIRSRILDVVNDTNDSMMQYQTTTWFDEQFLAGAGSQGSPMYYNLNGVDSNGDSQADLYPIPDGNYVVRFNMVIPQADLESDGDEIKVPYQLVVEGALARAISERGDDGGYIEQEARYQRILSDYIAIDAGNRPDETIWYSV